MTLCCEPLARAPLLTMFAHRQAAVLSVLKGAGVLPHGGGPAPAVSGHSVAFTQCFLVALLRSRYDFSPGACSLFVSFAILSVVTIVLQIRGSGHQRKRYWRMSGWRVCRRPRAPPSPSTAFLSFPWRRGWTRSPPSQLHCRHRSRPSQHCPRKAICAFVVTRSYRLRAKVSLHTQRTRACVCVCACVSACRSTDNLEQSVPCAATTCVKNVCT